MTPHLILLHHPDGSPVWVNAAHVLTIEADGRGPGALVAFAVAGRSWSDETSAETEPYRIAVSETPTEVAEMLVPGPSSQLDVEARALRRAGSRPAFGPSP